MLGEMIDRAKRGDNQFEYEHRIVMPGGSTKYIDLIGHAVRDAEGHVEYFGAAHDITRRRIAEQALGNERAESQHDHQHNARAGVVCSSGWRSGILQPALARLHRALSGAVEGLGLDVRNSSRRHQCDY